MSDIEAFIEHRVAGLRQMLDIDIPLDSDELPPAISLGCSESGITAVILPTTSPGVLHLQVHAFVDGVAVAPVISTSDDTPVELVLHRTVPMT